MYVRDQPTKQEQQPNPTVIATLEATLNSGNEFYHCSGQNHSNLIYKDPNYQIPLLELDRIQEQLEFTNPSSVITFLESRGYTIKKELCGECHQQVMDGMAQT